jgi:predicted dehydrogenase
MTPLRIGLVGLGVIARHYLAAIDRRPDVALAAVCDLRADSLAGHRVPGFRDHLAMLRAVELDAVLVTAPNDAHAAICRDALVTGLAVCVEKPLALTLDEGRELDLLARQRSRPLFTAFHRRYNDNVRALRTGLRDAPPVTDVTVRYCERIEDHVGGAGDDWYLDPARCGGGCVADNGPNAFDLARLVLDDQLRVTDAAIDRDAAGVDRQAVVALRGSRGGRVRVELDWSFPGERKEVEVRLADGTGRRADLLAGYPGFKSSLRHEYVGVLRDFTRAVAGAETGAADGLAALALVDAAYRSVRV